MQTLLSDTCGPRLNRGEIEQLAGTVQPELTLPRLIIFKRLIVAIHTTSCYHMLMSTDEYDRGFTEGANHTHELLSKHIEQLKYQRDVIEDEGTCKGGLMSGVWSIQKQVNALEHAKLVIRKGFWDNDCEMPW